MVGSKNILEEIYSIIKNEYNCYIKSIIINKYSFTKVEFYMVMDSELFLINHTAGYELVEKWDKDSYEFNEISHYLDDWSSQYAINGIKIYFKNKEIWVT